MKLNNLHENLPGGPLGGDNNRFFDLIITLPSGETVTRNRLEQYTDFTIKVMTPAFAERAGYQYFIQIAPSGEGFRATDYSMKRSYPAEGRECDFGCEQSSQCWGCDATPR